MSHFDHKYTAVLIEPRKHLASKFVLCNMLDCLSEDWKILFFHGDDNKEYAKKIVDEDEDVIKMNMGGKRVELIQLEGGVKNLNQKTYSELLASKLEIYHHIKTEYFLIFQTDSMMFKRNAHIIQYFIDEGYDYVGAPWLISGYAPTAESDFIGNGGFSLRKKSKMIEIIEKNNRFF